MSKGPSSLLRGGIPSGPSIARKSLKQSNSKLNEMVAKGSTTGKSEESKESNNQFYNMEELFDLLDLP